MKILVPLLLVFLAISCKKEESSSYGSMEDINKKITQNKPFFDFDEIIHYHIPIDENEYYDLILADTISEKGKIFEFLLREPCPETKEEKIKFKEAIKSVEKEENTINSKYYDELRTQVFSEKRCDQFSMAACEPIYRDIFIFKKNKEETGMAKICFKCWLYSISNKEAITDCFNMNGELTRLKKIISENKKN
ncbi:hypothetical protein ABH942_000443 [Flavobacterium sp. 28YEA47A]|uniref:hypothetical protein n=1 Tax=Flavobacterium sp. 28YEA47A TaxID=3156276 RepID=UPI0035114C0E